MQFRERYDIIKLLGRGTNASVFLVRDKHLDKYWAAKIFDIGNLSQTDLWNVENEIQILKQIRSPQMPGIIDLYRENHQICLVIDYFEGISLEGYIKKYGAVCESTAIEWMEELADILGQLHTKEPPIVYCDLKPENVILQKDGHLALIDFGSGRQLSNTDMPLAGSQGYTAPELFFEKPTLAINADIYSIGAVGTFLVTGMQPDSWQQFKMEFSKHFVHIIDSCLREPEKRLKNSEAIKKEIAAWRGKYT